MSEDNPVADLSPHTLKEIANMVVGRFLGEGVYRKVYTHMSDPKLVVKIEQRAKSFSNILEWEIWEYAKHTEGAKQWLAPCVSISPCGTVLVQKRTTIITKAEFPKRIPAWLTDIKLANWGRLGDKVVCHDYSNNLLMNPVAEKNIKLKVAKLFTYGTRE